MFYLDDPSTPLFSGSSDLICDDVSFYNGLGVLTKGTKNCSGAEFPNCINDGDSNCVVKSGYRAAILAGSADKILVGETLGGVAGTIELPATSNVASGVKFGAGGSEFTGEAAAIPAICTEDGKTGCVTTDEFKSAKIDGAASKILSGQSLAGVAGNVELPDANKVLYGTNFGSASLLSGLVLLCSGDG